MAGSAGTGSDRRGLASSVARSSRGTQSTRRLKRAGFIIARSASRSTGFTASSWKTESSRTSWVPCVRRPASKGKYDAPYHAQNTGYGTSPSHPSRRPGKTVGSLFAENHALRPLSPQQLRWYVRPRLVRRERVRSARVTGREFVCPATLLLASPSYLRRAGMSVPFPHRPGKSNLIGRTPT